LFLTLPGSSNGEFAVVFREETTNWEGIISFTSSSQPTGANAVCRRSKQQLQVLAVLKYLIMEGRVLLNDGEM